MDFDDFNMDYYFYDDPPDPECYGDCVRLGDEVETSDGAVGPVCWEGGWRGRHRLGVKLGDSLEFYDCRDVRRCGGAFR